MLSHPLHELVKSGGKKSTKTYRMSFSMINKLNSINPFSYKLGAQMCKKHELIIKANQESSANQILEEEDDYMICDVSFQDDPYVPPVYPVDNDTSIEDLTNISRKFGVSPVKYKLSKPIDEVCRSNQRYFKRKRAQFLLGAQNHFDQTFAPGQPTERVKEVLGEEQGNSIPKDLYSLVENYEKSDSFGKLSILSIVDHKKHSKAELMKYFHCSKRKIEQARALQVKEEGVHSKEIVTFKRNRMNTEKCEHFLNFLFSSGLIQDVAYGMTNIKFDSGDVQSIPHTISHTKFSHTIDFYKTSCSELNYTPLSTTTLRKVLKAINPSQRKSLAGLDDVTADAMNGFELLNKTLKEKRAGRELTCQLERAKRYLIMNYQLSKRTTQPLL